jgi:hypothetical protein
MGRNLNCDSDRTPPTSQTANCLQQRFAIALPQLPNSELLAAALRYRTASTPKQRTACSSASLSHPSNFPKQRFLGRASLSHPLNFPKQRFLGRASLSHPLNFPTSFLTNHEDTKNTKEEEKRREERANFIFSRQVSLFAIKLCNTIRKFIKCNKIRK